MYARIQHSSSFVWLCKEWRARSEETPAHGDWAFVCYAIIDDDDGSEDDGWVGGVFSAADFALQCWC